MGDRMYKPVSIAWPRGALAGASVGQWGSENLVPRRRRRFETVPAFFGACALVLACAGCSSIYLHDDKVEKTTAEAKEASDRVSLGEQFTAQEKFLKDLDDRTREIELRAKLTERDLAIAQLMDETRDSFTEFDSRRILVLGASDHGVPGLKSVQSYREQKDIADREERAARNAMAPVLEAGGKFKGKDVCVASGTASLFDTAGVSPEQQSFVKSRIDLLTRDKGVMSRCFEAKQKAANLEKQLDAAVDSETKENLRRAEGKLKEIEAAAKKADEALKTINAHLACLRATAAPSAEIDEALVRMRDLLLVLGGKEVALPTDPAGEEAKGGEKPNAGKGGANVDPVKCAKIAQDYEKLPNLGGPAGGGQREPDPSSVASERDNFAVGLRTVTAANKIAAAVLPGFAKARTEFLENELVRVLVALAKDESADSTAPKANAAEAEKIATARAWVSSLRALVDTAAELGNRNRPSLEAILIEIAYQQYLKAEAEAEIGDIKKRVELLQRLRTALIFRAAYWGSATEARTNLAASIAQKECKAIDERPSSLAKVIDACKGTATAKHAADILMFVGQSFNRGDIQAHLLEFEIANLDRKKALALDRAAFEARVAMLKPAVTTLARYGASGVKASDIAQLLQLLGLGSISYGVN